jgi:Fic family protein
MNNLQGESSPIEQATTKLEELKLSESEDMSAQASKQLTKAIVANIAKMNASIEAILAREPKLTN